MAAMNSRSKVNNNKQLSFESVLDLIKKDNPDIILVEADIFLWSSDERKIYYNPNYSYETGDPGDPGESSPDSSKTSPVWSLLHELGHYLNNHSNYSNDLELVLMEAEAWSTAQKVAERYGLTIDEDHIQDCLDSYRDWQHKRSTCPSCSQTGLQKNKKEYRCLNCFTGWSVTPRLFCRVYRLQKTS